MIIQPVESTTLTGVAYDAVARELYLIFRDETVYRYFGVSSEVYDHLLNSESKGGYFNRAIRGRFTYERFHQ
jgi:hypothetical protein